MNKNKTTDTEMTREQAAKILSKYNPKNTIARIYDYKDVDIAFLTLIPGFEYPDWSYQTLAYALAYIKEISRLKSNQKELKT